MKSRLRSSCKRIRKPTSCGITHPSFGYTVCSLWIHVSHVSRRWWCSARCFRSTCEHLRYLIPPGSPARRPILGSQLPRRIHRPGAQDADCSTPNLGVKLVYRLPGPFTPLSIQLTPAKSLLCCRSGSRGGRAAFQGNPLLDWESLRERFHRSTAGPEASLWSIPPVASSSRLPTSGIAGMAKEKRKTLCS